MSQPWNSGQVVTGEAVALELRLAALPSRVVAGALDAVLQLVLLVALGGLAAAISADVSEAAAAALGMVVLVSVLIVYPVAFETLLRGRTPGKAAMGLRVVRDDGGPIGFRHALVRGLAGAFVERPGITLFVAAVVTSLLNPQNKRIGDLLAGSVVLQERVAVRGGQVAVMPPPLAPWAAGLDLSGLSDELALSTRQFLSRSAQLTPAARDELGGRLVAAVTAAVHPPPPPGTPGWAVLSAVLAERRRREEQRLTAHRRPAPRPAPAPDPRPAPHPAPHPAASVSQHTPAAAASGRNEERRTASPSPPSPTEPGPGGFVAPG